MTESANDQITARLNRLEANLTEMRKRLAGTQAVLMIITDHFARDASDSAQLSLRLKAFQNEHESALPAEYFEAFDDVQGQLASRN